MYAYFILNLAGKNLLARCIWIITTVCFFYLFTYRTLPQVAFANVTPSIFCVPPAPHPSLPYFRQPVYPLFRVSQSLALPAIETQSLPTLYLAVHPFRPIPHTPFRPHAKY